MNKKIGVATLGVALLGCASVCSHEAQASDTTNVSKEDGLAIRTIHNGTTKKEDVDSAKKAHEVATKQVGDAQAKKTQVSSNLQEKMAAKKSTEDKLAKVAGADKKISDEKTKIASLETKKVDLDKKVKEQDVKKGALLQSVKDHETLVGDNKTIVSEKEKEIKVVNDQIKNVTNSASNKFIEAKKAEIETIKSNIAVKNNEINAKEKDIEKTKADDASRVKKMEEISKERDALDKKAKDLRTREIAKQDELKTLKEKKSGSPFIYDNIKISVSLDPRFVKGLDAYLNSDDLEFRKKKLNELFELEKEIVGKQVRFKLATDPEYKDDEKIDIANISEKDNIMYSQYFVMLNNQIRKQFGKVAQKVNLNTQKFIREASKITMNDDYSELMHYHRGLNRAAYKFGIDAYDHGNEYNRFESQDYTYARKSENKHVSKRFLFDALHNSLLRFYYEAHMTGHYGHAKHLLSDTDTIAVGFAITSDPSVASMNLDQLKISVAGVHKYTHHNRQEWVDKYSINSRDNLEPITYVGKVDNSAKIASLEKELTRISNEHYDTVRARTAKEIELDELRSVYSKVNALVGQLNSLKSFKTMYENDLRITNNELNGLIEGSTRSNAQAIELNRKLDKLKADLKVLVKDLDDAVNELEKVKRNYVKADIDLTDLKSRLNGVNEEISASNKVVRSLNELKLQEDDLKGEVGELNGEITKLQDEVKAYDGKILELEKVANDKFDIYNKLKIQYESELLTYSVPLVAPTVDELPEYIPEGDGQNDGGNDGQKSGDKASDKEPGDVNPGDKEPGKGGDVNSGDKVPGDVNPIDKEHGKGGEVVPGDKDPIKEAGKEPIKELGKELGKEPIKELSKGGKQSGKDPVKDVKLSVKNLGNGPKLASEVKGAKQLPNTGTIEQNAIMSFVMMILGTGLVERRKEN